jgi:DNA-binding MarR family transcriptional regulator
MGELSKALAVPLSTATRIVDGLVDNGFATRVADPDDRRVVRITLTEDGREMYRVLGEYMRQRIQHILHPLTAQEQNQLVSLLGKVADSMDEGGD